MLRPRFSAFTVALSYIAVSLVVLAPVRYADPIRLAQQIVEERSTERLGEDAQRLANVLREARQRLAQDRDRRNEDGSAT